MNNHIYVIKNGTIWHGPGETVTHSGDIYIENGFITANLSDRQKESAEIIDVHNRLIMPGLTNAHTHLYSSLARGMPGPSTPPTNFNEILERVWWKLDKNLDKDLIALSALAGGIEALKSGITTLFDHHASPSCIDNSLSVIHHAMTQLGLRADLCYEVSDRDGPDITMQGIHENIRFINSTNDHTDGRIHGHFGLHALFTLNDDTLEVIADHIENLKAGIHMHLAEGPEDNQICQDKYGIGVLDRIQKFNLITNDSLVIHGVHLNPHDMARLSEYPVRLVHNPLSNMNNAVGILDVVAAKKSGLNLCLGNDGLGGAILPELRASLFAGHIKSGTPNQPDWTLITDILFRNNTHLASQTFDTPIGKIKPGFAADLIVVDYQPPTPITASNIAGHFIFGLCERMRVTDSFIQGRHVLANGYPTGIDCESVLSETKKAANILWSKLSK